MFICFLTRLILSLQVAALVGWAEPRLCPAALVAAMIPPLLGVLKGLEARLDELPPDLRGDFDL
jgi:hypothetical protein